MQNSVIIFTFSASDWKYPFWANLLQKFEIISLSWNLVPKLIEIYRIQWLCSFYLEISFLGKFSPKKTKIFSFYWNLVLRLIQICRMQWWCSRFLFLTGNTFLGKFDLEIKIVSLSCKLVLRLIQIWRIQWWCSFFLFSTGTNFFLEIEL